jgi:hypothetical protein
MKHTTNDSGAVSMTLRPSVLALAVLAVVALGLVSAGSLPAQAAPAGPASPLAAYPGFGHDPRADEARYEKEAQAREELIAACMAEAGFTYHPEPPSVVVGEMLPPPSLLRAVVRPNDRVVAGLSDAQKLRYNRALYGVDDPNDPRAEAQHDPSSPVGGGCLAAAHRAVPGVFAAKSALTEELLEMERQVRNDYRVEQAELRWAQCMSGLGYSYDSPRSLNAALDEKLALSHVTGETMEEIVRDQEQAVGVAQVCGERIRFAETVAAVRLEAETAFVEEHEALLEEHRARVGVRGRMLPGLNP